MTVTVTFAGDVPTILSEMRDFLGAVANDSQPAPAMPAPVELTPKPAARRGRPPKAAETAPEPPESPQETSTPEPEPTPVQKPAAAPAPAPAAATGDAVDVAEVRKALIAVVQKIGKAECAALCQKHGGANLTALDPKVYPALLADARAMLSAVAEG